MAKTLTLTDDQVARCEGVLRSIELDEESRLALQDHFYNVVIPAGELIELPNLCVIVAAMYDVSIREALRCLSEGCRRGKVKLATVQ